MAFRRAMPVYVTALKTHTYKQRHIPEGALYQPAAILAKLYARAGLVRPATDGEIARHERRPLPVDVPELDALRAQYEQLAGEPAKKVWGVRKLRAEIAARELHPGVAPLPASALGGSVDDEDGAGEVPELDQDDDDDGNAGDGETGRLL